MKDLKEFAKKVGADLIGIANIERFKEITPQYHPSSIFPETKSVVVIGKRITRGTLRGIEEGTQFEIYDLYGYNWLNDRFLAITTFKIAEFLEDNGWEAVPLPNLPLQIPPMGIPVRPHQPPPNVLIDFDDGAVRAGLGEISYCGVFLTPEFGPRQRIQLVLTDAEFDPDPILQESICDNCMECVKECPLNAINPKKEILLTICNKKMTVAEIDYTKCASCKNGARPNLYYPSAIPDRLGAICVRSCLSHLEKTSRVKNRFQKLFRKRPSWKMGKSGEVVLEEKIE